MQKENIRFKHGFVRVCVCEFRRQKKKPSEMDPNDFPSPHTVRVCTQFKGIVRDFGKSVYSALRGLIAPSRLYVKYEATASRRLA